MPLENSNTIKGLDETWPSPDDPVDRGDDHIRLIKHVLKTMFPGMEVALTAKIDFLNGLENKISTMEAAIKNANPVGSIVIRNDNIDPSTVYPGTKWTRLSADEAAFFLGNGGNGGSVTGDNNVAVPVASHSHSFSGSGNANHSHYMFQSNWNNYGNPVQNAPDSRVAGGGIKRQETDRDDYRMMQSVGGAECGVTAQASLSVAISGTTAAAGTENATIDVRGKRAYFNAWKRTE